MILKPQDVLVALKIWLLNGQVTLQQLSTSLGLSVSEVHAATKRGLQSRLLAMDGKVCVAVRENLLEFLVHGVPYAFPPDRGGLTRGLRTAHAAPVLQGLFARSSAPPPVWPDPLGDTRGESFSPLYRSAPLAAKIDAQLYALLALIDAIRGGRARDRAIATKLLAKRLAK
jgi:hypothetical protein